MCGRYGLYDIADKDIIKENKGYHFKPNYNVAPTQKMPVITEGDGKKQIEEMQWGIHRQIGPNVEKDIINTRSDKAFERFWGKTVRSHRCLIPANGFFEWRTAGKVKTPFWIHPTDMSYFTFAGIFSIDAEGTKHYSIMTTTPNKEMSDVHNRMPVILTSEHEKLWLADGDDQLLEELLRPLPDKSLEIVEVSKEVNSPRNNYPELIEAALN